MIRNQSKPQLEFGVLLQSAIKEAHISRQFISDNLQCSIDAVDNWCCGRARISPNRLHKLCSLLTTKGLTNKRVRYIHEKALEAHGFFTTWPPNRHAGARFTLCLLGSLSHRKELWILQVISDYLSGVNQEAMIVHCGDKVDMLLSGVDLASQITVANLILCGTSAPPDIYRLLLDKMDEQDASVILILTDCPAEVAYSHRNAYVIAWSDYGLAYKATTLLIDAGHTRIGTIHLEKHASRFSGYLQALRDKGVDPDPRTVIDGGTLASYQSIADLRFMHKLERSLLQDTISAVFTSTELLTLAVPVLLLKNGKAPYDDISLCGLAYPGWVGQGLNLPVTYLQYPIQEVARIVLDVLLRQSMLSSGHSEDRYIDVTKLAKRIDTAKYGSIRQIS